MKYRSPVSQYAYNEAQAYDLSRLTSHERNALTRFAIKQILSDVTVIERDPETRMRMMDDVVKKLKRYIPKV